MIGLPISARYFTLLGMILVLLLLPRFDRLDHLGLDGYSTHGDPASEFMADAEKYRNHVLYFRGEVSSSELRKPWAYRPLPALVASFLPFDALTSINIVNGISLLTGLFFLLKLLGLLKVSTLASGVGGLLYACSFPVFYYGSIGYIDPVLVGFVTLSTHLIFARKNTLFFVSLICGAFIKETYIVVLPAWAVYQLMATPRSFLATCAISSLCLAVFIAIIIGLRIFTPVGADFFWYPSQEMIQFNVFRLRSWLSFALTFGIAGVLACIYLFKSGSNLLDESNSMALATGFFGSLLIFSYSMISAYADGRYFWTAYPFMIPLACMQIDRWRGLLSRP